MRERDVDDYVVAACIFIAGFITAMLIFAG